MKHGFAMRQVENRQGEEGKAFCEKQQLRYKRERAQLAIILKKTVRELRKYKTELQQTQKFVKELLDEKRELEKTQHTLALQMDQYRNSRELSEGEELNMSTSENVTYLPRERELPAEKRDTLAATLKTALIELKCARVALREEKERNEEWERKAKLSRSTSDLELSHLQESLQQYQARCNAYEANVAALEENARQLREQLENSLQAVASQSGEKSHLLQVIEEQRQSLSAKEEEIAKFQTLAQERNELQEKLIQSERKFQEAVLSKQLNASSLQSRLKEAQLQTEETALRYQERIDALTTKMADCEEQLQNTLAALQHERERYQTLIKEVSGGKEERQRHHEAQIADLEEQWRRASSLTLTTSCNSVRWRSFSC